MRPLPLVPLLLLLALPPLARTAETLIVPDPSIVPADDEKKIRKMIDEYLKAVVAGDRDKALKLCTFKNKDQEKISRLACEVDFVIAKLRDTVEKKFGKEAWGDLGEGIGEMTPRVMKESTLTATESPDEVTLTWSEKQQDNENALAPFTVTIRHVKEGWRFTFDDAPAGAIQFRREVRDEIAELTDITAAVADGTIKDADGLKQAITKFVKEVHDADAGELMPDKDGIAPIPIQPIAPMVEPE